MFNRIKKFLYHFIHLNRWVFVINSQNKRLDTLEITIKQYHSLNTTYSEKLIQQEEKLQDILIHIEDSIKPIIAKQLFYHAMSMHQRIDQFLLDMKQEQTLIDEVTVNSINNAKAIFMNDYYLAFENTFRGSRDEIIKRYIPYLDYIKLKNIENVLDIGCGRGEWLALLKSQGINAKGVDINHAMIDICHQNGIHHNDAICENALSYLEQYSDGSFDVISAFHIIEHLSMESILSLLIAVKRVLKPNGKLLLETPNPDNFLVSSLTFYNDLTHRNPIPKEVTKFMVEYTGFEEIEIIPLHPFPNEMHFQETSDISKVLNAKMFGPQDYLLIAQKAYEH